MIEIIEDGIDDDFVYRCECLNCGTTFEYTSDEIKLNTVGTMVVRCPKCGNQCYHIGNSVSVISTIRNALNKLKNRLVRYYK